MDDKYHYNILGLKTNASQSEINKAWKNLALIYHPDKTKLDKAEASEKFIQIEKSYQHLKSQNELTKSFQAKIDEIIIDSKQFDREFENNLMSGFRNVSNQRSQHLSVLNLLGSLNNNLSKSQKRQQQTGNSEKILNKPTMKKEKKEKKKKKKKKNSKIKQEVKIQEEITLSEPERTYNAATATEETNQQNTKNQNRQEENLNEVK